jgi:hypothetical protein
VSSSQITARGNLTPGCYLTSVPDCFRALHIEEADARNAQFGTDGMCSAEVVSRPMPSGVRNRDSAVYINVQRADGSIETVGSRPGGVHAEDVAQALEPGGQMSRPFGWRGDPTTQQITWQPINVCPCVS